MIKKIVYSPSIGVFDSGVGGLSVLKEIRKELPQQNLIYFGDQAHVPYGPRSLQEVCDFSTAITEFLISLGARLIVVACNTASAASLSFLRTKFPTVPFVGMEPAIKPAVEKTTSGTVAVLATPATFQSKLYCSIIERFANGVEVYQDTCPGLVQEIEKGNFSGKETRKILENALDPLLDKGIDVVVLGCTHYPFVIPLIEEIVGPSVRVIDPSPAIARQTHKLINEHNLTFPKQNNGDTLIITSATKVSLTKLIGQYYPYENELAEAKWNQFEIQFNLTQ